MFDVKIGDKVILVAPSGKTRTVTVTDVIRPYNGSKEILAIEYMSQNGVSTLPIKFFKEFK